MTSKAKLAFDLLEQEMEVIGKPEQRTFLGGTGTNPSSGTADTTNDVYTEYAAYLNEKLAIANLAANGASKTATIKEIKAAQEELRQIRSSAAMKFENEVKAYAAGSDPGSGETKYDATSNSYKSTFTKNASGSVDKNLMAHEIHHQFQFLNGDVDKNNMATSYTKEDERASYRRMLAIQYGTAYYDNESQYEQIIIDHVNTEYSHLPGSTGGSSGGPSTGNEPVTTGYITTGWDDQGYYFNYSITDVYGNYSTGISREVTFTKFSTGHDEEGYYAHYVYMDPNGPYTTSSGNYSTGLTRDPNYGNG